MKERYAITDMRKLANRMQFGIPEESSLGDGLVEGYGMLGQAGSGKLRVSMRQSKHAAKVAKKFKEKLYGGCGATSGLTSSLACTPVCRGSSSRIHRLMHTSLAVEPIQRKFSCIRENSLVADTVNAVAKMCK
ncbi:U4/U6 small nuclear ribonucleoprotein Prp31 homolog isoform X1 [Pyrus x bretschneideri]|uniref:U4/U6 small nuclear ribonucleoprotein Prp31 homolog isoform X1 n=1 Tax=Pyrus x bretschneideri TaxID=225117 RepID=UPI00202F80B4|nr:U4/U6 small nuclear ribonucleoprotein Prp31 homolog isoform X1 [Pyrus x bretschneideri]